MKKAFYMMAAGCHRPLFLLFRGDHRCCEEFKYYFP